MIDRSNTPCKLDTPPGASRELVKNIGEQLAKKYAAAADKTVTPKLQKLLIRLAEAEKKRRN